MSDLRDYSDRLWRGEIDTGPGAIPGMQYKGRQAEELSDRMLYYKGASSVTTIDADGTLVMLDSGAAWDAEPLYQAIRSWRPTLRLASAVFSHHHIDHIFGVTPFDREAVEKRLPRPQVFGHELIGEHFDRYKKTEGWNGAINTRQFMRPDSVTIEPQERLYDYRYPDVTYRHGLVFREGDLTFELHHTRGETEDATWTWIEELDTLFTGDLFIWAVPNAGNPQKVQRWVGEWATGLREMASKGAGTMIPGHGLPIFGAGRVQQALTDTADLLESIETQTIALMNQGATLDTVIHEVRIAEDALQKPYLRPVYDHPQFVIRNVWRLYGGWYDGEPDNLLPAPRAEQAREWVELAGGVQNVLDRCEELRTAGNLRLACHLAEQTVLAEPRSTAAHEMRTEVYEARAQLEMSFMPRGIFTFAANSSRLGKRDFYERDP